MFIDSKEDFVKGSHLPMIPLLGYHGQVVETKNKLIRRLKIIEGQIRGLQGLIEKDTYCIDVITQTSAVKQALSNIEDVLLEEHLSHCVVDQIKSGYVKKPIGEILQVYRLKRK